MSRLEEFITESKLNELLRKKEDERQKNVVLWILAIVGAVAAVAGIAYAVYCFFTPDYLEDFEEDFEDEFDDYFSEEDQA
jgi:flagellar basal body-associated protein FliL